MNVRCPRGLPCRQRVAGIARPVSLPQPSPAAALTGRQLLYPRRDAAWPGEVSVGLTASTLPWVSGKWFSLTETEQMQCLFGMPLMAEKCGGGGVWKFGFCLRNPEQTCSEILFPALAESRFHFGESNP